MTIRERDLGWSRIVREMGAAGRARVYVGIQGAKGSAIHDAESKLTNAELGAVLEHGTTDGHIPARPFLRGTVDARESRYRKLLRGAADAVASGRMPLAQALGLVGEVVVGDVKQAIADGVPPPNAESTVIAKGSGKPLIDQGQLRNSITYDVRG